MENKNNLKNRIGLLSPLIAVFFSLSFFVFQYLLVPESFVPESNEFSEIVWTYLGYYLPLICGGYFFRWVYRRLVMKYKVWKIVLGGLLLYILFEFQGITPFGAKREILLGILPGCLYILFLSGLLKLTYTESGNNSVTVSEKEIGLVWLRLLPLLCGIGVFFVNHLRVLLYHFIFQPEPPLVGWDFSPFAVWANFLLTVTPMVVMGYLTVGGYCLLIRWDKKLLAVFLLVFLGGFVFWNSLWLSDYGLRDIAFALLNVAVFMTGFILVLFKNIRITVINKN